MSYEAVAHRVCNLGDPKRPGIPMHFIRCDVAGNISKRYSATGLRFPEGTGSCAKWAVHNAFLNPSIITRQYSMMPDGTTYFCFAQGDRAAGAGLGGARHDLLDRPRHARRRGAPSGLRAGHAVLRSPRWRFRSA